MRHDPPRIVYAGRVWRGTMEVPMPTMTHEAVLREKIRATLRLLSLGLDDADLAELTATYEALERTLVAINEARRAEAVAGGLVR